MNGLLNRYKIIDELGRGGMGVVYKVRDTKLGRTVALKRLRTKDNLTLIERFEGEAKSIAALNHPNIIQIFDFGRDAEGLYITTEYVDGTDLHKLIQNQGLLLPKVAMKLIVPICQALEYAHQRKVIHRDIKPANILINREGVPKIADFGLARTESMKSLEVTGVIMGTRAYASPEQFTDAKHIDHRTDIYSVGCMFYQMVTGKNPQFLREVDIPDPLAPIILKAVEREASRRYSSLRVMLSDLADVARAEPAGGQAPVVPVEPVQSASPEEPTVQSLRDTNMILIPEGPFPFGEQGQQVSLEAFFIDKFPVTNEQFARFKSNHSYSPDEANHPATHVTWIEANHYARKMGKRLPTEAEWEKAARGAEGNLFPWGNTFSPEFCNTAASKIDSTTPVDSYPEGQSKYGVMDLAGNVWEWTSSYLDERKTARILKGGAYNGQSKFALAYARFAYPEKGSMPTAGFRCARGAR